MPPPYCQLSAGDLDKAILEWRPKIREVLERHHGCRSTWHQHVREYMVAHMGYDIYLWGRSKASVVVDEESVSICAADKCNYLLPTFNLGDVGFGRTYSASTLEDGETLPPLFVAEDPRKGVFQTCIRTDAHGLAFAMAGSAFPQDLQPPAPSAPTDAIAEARDLGIKRERFTGKFVTSLLTSESREAVHLAADVFDWWYGARCGGGVGQAGGQRSPNAAYIASTEFINVRRAMLECETIRDVKVVFKALNADIGVVLAGVAAAAAMAFGRAAPNLSKRKRSEANNDTSDNNNNNNNKYDGVRVWETFLENDKVAADIVPQILDFCVRYVREYDTHAAFSSAADRLLSSMASVDVTMTINMLRESLRV